MFSGDDVSLPQACYDATQAHLGARVKKKGSQGMPYNSWADALG